MTVNLTHIPVGVLRALQPVVNVRTPAQRETVAAIVAGPDFAFASNNPLCRGATARPFYFIWTDTRDRLHTMNINKHGRITSEVIVWTRDGIQSTMTRRG